MSGAADIDGAVDYPAWCVHALVYLHLATARSTSFVIWILRCVPCGLLTHVTLVGPLGPLLLFALHDLVCQLRMSPLSQSRILPFNTARVWENSPRRVCYSCSSACLRTSPKANDWISAVDTGVTPTNEDTGRLVAHVRRCSKKAFVDTWGVSWGLCRACYRSDTARARAAPSFPPPSSTDTLGSPPPLTFRAVSVAGVDAAPSASSPWWVVVLSS